LDAGVSAVCAILRLDGQAAAAEMLAPVLAGLAARGPDGAMLRAEGAAVLGHALNATTPEALSEPMPWHHAPTACMVSADARLDNRAALMEALGIDPAGRVIGDGELILAAYLKWGRDCPAHLMGDFAFVLWDPRAQRLFAARDQVGMRQLAYHFAPGRLFACATDADALLRQPDVPRRINRARIADFLEQLEAMDASSTFFEGLARLPPAHSLTVENGALRLSRYWQLEPQPPLTLPTDEAYAEAFRAMLDTAVRSRLRAPEGRLAAMLSGGMDSGSVVALTARQRQAAGAPPLVTLSAVDTLPDCKETACVRDALAFIPHLAPRIVSTADMDKLRDQLIALTQAETDPFDGHMTMVRALYLDAQRAGIRTVLDGVSADTTLGTGDMINYFAAHGRLRDAWAEAHCQERDWKWEGVVALPAFARALRRRFTPEWLRARRKQAWEAVEAARQARESILTDAFAAEVAMPERRRAFARNVAVKEGWDQTSQAQRILHPYALAGRERYDRVAGAHGIEPRDPYLDTRLLEFCLSLPLGQLHADGWPKMIQRRAMAGMLPDSVRWKMGRDHVGWRFIDECFGPSPTRLHNQELAKFCKLETAETDSAGITLQCSTRGVVSETDLGYLNFWITRFKDFWD
jgi:asparagine synthase (glutamine-hydrolysing)